MCNRFSYCHGGGGYLSLYFLAERQEIKGRQSSLLARRSFTETAECLVERDY